MLNVVIENFKSIKKDQSEKKDILTEKKNNSQEINSTIDKAENQISNLEYKEAKNNQSEEEEEKRIQKNEYSERALWSMHNQVHQHSHHWGVGRRRERARNWKSI